MSEEIQFHEQKTVEKPIITFRRIVILLSSIATFIIFILSVLIKEQFSPEGIFAQILATLTAIGTIFATLVGILLISIAVGSAIYYLISGIRYIFIKI